MNGLNREKLDKKLVQVREQRRFVAVAAEDLCQGVKEVIRAGGECACGSSDFHISLASGKPTTSHIGSILISFRARWVLAA